MDYKIVIILSDLSCVTLYKVPMNLYTEILNYLKKDSGFPSFQKLYDNLCKDEEDQDSNLKSYYESIENCDTIDGTLIQVY